MSRQYRAKKEIITQQTYNAGIVQSIKNLLKIKRHKLPLTAQQRAFKKEQERIRILHYKKDCYAACYRLQKERGIGGEEAFKILGINLEKLRTL